MTSQKSSESARRFSFLSKPTGPTGEEKAKIIGLALEQSASAAEICLALGGNLSIAEIQEVINDWESSRAIEQSQLLKSALVPEPPLHLQTPLHSAHIQRSHRLPNCDSQFGANGSDALGEHFADLAD